MYNQFFQVPDGELLNMVAGRAVPVRNANAAELITAIESGAITGAAARKIAALLELSRRLCSRHLADNKTVSGIVAAVAIALGAYWHIFTLGACWLLVRAANKNEY